MEKEPLENKMLRDLKGGITSLNNSLDSSLKTIDQALRKELGPKGYARWEAYNRKVQKLHAEGKTGEIKELEKIFLSGK